MLGESLHIPRGVAPLTYLHKALVTGILHIRMHYSKEKYARIIVWCLGVLLDGWPWHIPFTNLSDIIGGAASLRLLRDLMRDGRLKFI
ncbi:hypothetical protein LXA43DRAFT_895290, partial [Ganoderma leucocontextum]